MAAEKTFFALGTVNTVRIFDSEDFSVLEKVVKRVCEIDDRMSAFKSDSDIVKISQQAGIGFVKVHKETYELIKKAIGYCELTKGTFDITMRPLIELWGVSKKDDFIPTDTKIQEALSKVNYKDILLDEKKVSIAMRKTGQSIDLGGIAKGYAADEAKRILVENGIKNAIVNFGGNIVAIGKKLDGQEWKIGIQNPLKSTGEYLGVLSAWNKTIVTSGSNEKFFLKDGVRYHHILDPRTGKPAQNELLSATAVCNSSTEADALTTALFILGPEASIEILEKLDVEAIFVTKNLDILVTNGLKENFKIIEDNNKK